MYRLLRLSVLLLLSPLWGQEYECPCGAGNTCGFNQSAITGCTPGTTPDCIKAYCGVPNGASVSSSGPPVRSVADLGAYSSNSFTGFGPSGNEPSAYENQRAMNYYLANATTNPVNNNCDVVFIHGGGDSGTTNPEAVIDQTSDGKPGPAFVVLDPNQNNSNLGCNFIYPLYGVSSSGTINGAITAGDSTFSVSVPAARFWPANADVPFQVTIETESVTVTSQTISSGGFPGAFTVIDTISGTFANNHPTGYIPWVSDMAGRSTQVQDTYDMVCAMAAIACNGWGNRHDIRLWGESHGAILAQRLGLMGPADKTFYRTGSNCEWTCANADDWQITAANGTDEIADQSSVTVLSSDGTEPLGNANEYGTGASGNIGGDKSLCQSGCMVDSGTPCTLGSCTSAGLTPNGTVSAWCQNAYKISPQANPPGNIPGVGTGDLHVPDIIPPFSVNAGNADTNVGTAQVTCFAQTFYVQGTLNVPQVIANDCSDGLCLHGRSLNHSGTYSSWWSGSQEIVSMFKGLNIPDTTFAYAVPMAWANSGPLPQATVNLPYAATVSATGGAGGVTYSISGGSLGPLSLNTTTGEITGTATTPQQLTFVLRACDSAGYCAIPDGQFSIDIIAASPNFILSASPASLSLQQGNQGTSTITTTISGGFNSAISLSASGMPSGTTVNFNPNPIPAPGSGNSTMNVTVGGSTPTGTYPITVTGDDGGIQQTTNVVLTVTAASVWQQGFDFRNSATFVTDPPGSTYVLATTAYPTTVGGVTFGWVKTRLVYGRDRNATVDPRLAGINYADNGSPATFYVDLPSAGTYNLSLALGDAADEQCWVQCMVQFFDGTTLLATVSGGAIASGYFYDAQGAKWSAADWPTNNLSQQVTLTGTRLTAVVGTSQATGDFTTVAFLGVAQLSSSPNFTLSASPTSLSIQQGNQGMSTITTSISGGFDSAISLSASGVPSGSAVSFNPNPIPGPGSGTSTMTITVGSSTPAGTYPITVTGDGGGIQQTTNVTLTVTAASGWQQGFDFRNSAAFVSDPAGDTYVLATTAYPTTVNGVTFGWVKTGLVYGRDRNATLDPRLAGINYADNGSPATFYVDLPSPGTYSLSLAMGDASYEQCLVQCQVQFFDGTTLLATVKGGLIAAGYFYDAQASQWSAAAWPTSNLSQQVTLTGTRLTMVVGTSQRTGDFTTLAFLGVTQVSVP